MPLPRHARQYRGAPRALPRDMAQAAALGVQPPPGDAPPSDESSDEELDDSDEEGMSSDFSYDEGDSDSESDRLHADDDVATCACRPRLRPHAF